tara:strand:+ start:263 stop:499 length:237 start_codon:yes stop_codon:yes gene_type:complete
MDWLFSFVTYNRRELNDYNYDIKVEGFDSFAKARDAAVKELPLGEKDNIYSQEGVEWNLQKVEVLDVDDEYYTNDKED